MGDATTHPGTGELSPDAKARKGFDVGGRPLHHGTAAALAATVYRCGVTPYRRDATIADGWYWLAGRVRPR